MSAAAIPVIANTARPTNKRSGFDRLSPELQFQITSTLGFRSLHEVQELTIDAVLDGDDTVVLAPTAGGKTEAAFFPLLSRMLAEDWRPISVLYLSPMRALLNNQEPRLKRYAQLVGRRAFKWHGDVPRRRKRHFIHEPTDILMTTPESLEVLLMSKHVPALELFQDLQAVVIDEVHAFAAQDRGAHMVALLTRLSRYCGRDIQRIGLSATVGNPKEVLCWVHGENERGARVVNPKAPQADPELVLDHVGDARNAALVTASLHSGDKRLMFVESRQGVEEMTTELRELGVDTFLTHGSLSLSTRTHTESQFEEGRDCVIVATSVLELGVDVGDLDRVVQHNAPLTVASLLQRMGRAGRRDGGNPNCLFLAEQSPNVLQAAAIIRLARNGYVEPVEPSRGAYHILAQQLMALAIQEGGIPRGDWWAWLEGAVPFADVTHKERELLVSHMLKKDLLTLDGGRLWLGKEGERIFGRRNFAKLYSVFTTPHMIIVRHNALEIGSLDASFVSMLEAQEHPCFVLAGEKWVVAHIDWRRGLCVVDRAELGAEAIWPGRGRPLSYEVCQAMREILIGDEIDPAWSMRARENIYTQRVEHSYLRAGESVLLKEDRRIVWWNFAGGRANALLADVLEAELDRDLYARNEKLALVIGKGDDAEQITEELIAAIKRLAKDARPKQADAIECALGRCKQRFSKFDVCLPKPLLAKVVAEHTLDVEGARRCVALADSIVAV